MKSMDVTRYGAKKESQHMAEKKRNFEESIARLDEIVKIWSAATRRWSSL
jgi:hypothetical protein